MFFLSPPTAAILLLPIVVVTLTAIFLERRIFFRLTEVPELLLSYSSSDSLCKTVSLQNNISQMVHVMINVYTCLSMTWPANALSLTISKNS